MSWSSSETQSIRVITDWPNPQAVNSNSEKVPSVISYNDNGTVKNWGYEVVPQDYLSLAWVKIMLESGVEEPKYVRGVKSIAEDNSAVLNMLGKTVDDVVSNFLGELWRYTKEDIRKRVSQTTWEDTVQVVLTVPAVWSGAAKERTIKAAQRAGIGGSLTLLSEPEAAALATLSGKAGGNTLKVICFLKMPLALLPIGPVKLIVPYRSERPLWCVMPVEAR